ncbi:hypothetical protein LUZ61_008818 [Rhynchospora tenuis]|uniref:Uncharacterized protein n=1 Tax=Rhynchospora tenuis TaxID=198213 RepID=A0AAD5ZWA9_9POAL|nr:hypothetical protein LUZ61_008818 [Rhynchospora tenuis]
MVTCFGSPFARTQIRGSILTRSKLHVMACSVAPAQTTRRSANYQPNSWDYSSLQSLKTRHQSESLTNYENVKREVKQLIQKETEPAKKLRLVDVIQRLGVAYLFDEEIKEALGSIFKSESAFKEDLLSMSLHFRLLRQNGFSVSQDIFSSFLEKNGTFKPKLQKDTKGLLSLYETSFLAFEAEELLDKARMFCSKHLMEAKPTLNPYLKGKIDHTLELPLHWRAPRLEARWSIDQYVRDELFESKLLQLAKLDFDRVQTAHQGEIGRVSRWWRDAALGEKHTFARDRLIECFFYATGIVFEPHLSACREILTKVFALIVHLDDVYDIYGTLEELVLFTDVMGKEELPIKFKAEVERGDTPSSIACYMRENGANENDARLAMHELTIDTWKKINMNALGTNPFPRSLADASMNLARISHCIYQGGDGLGAPDEEKKKLIKMLFLEPAGVKDENVFSEGDFAY